MAGGQRGISAAPSVSRSLAIHHISSVSTSTVERMTVVETGLDRANGGRRKREGVAPASLRGGREDGAHGGVRRER